MTTGVPRKSRTLPASALLFMLGAIIAATAGISHASDILTDLGPTFVARFDQSIAVDYPSNVRFAATGGAIVPGGISGKALRLKRLPTSTVRLKCSSGMRLSKSQQTQ
jgi:hypothetical protein